jgi:murein DD-endopeptidase MepM/ murein hydrolase activator NlpD
MKNRSGKVFVGLALLALLALAACAPEFNPPPNYQGGFLWNGGTNKTVTVELGDTLYAISQRYDVPTKVIIARNGLKPPYALSVGQQLILDPSRTHIVVKGDTLSQLAATYGVEMRLMAESNELTAPYVIRIGQELWIPDPFTIAAAPATAPRPVAEALPPASASTPVSPSRGAITSESLPPPPGTPIDLQTTVVEQTAETPATPPAPVPESGVQDAAETAVASLPPEPDVAVAPAPLTVPPPRASARFTWPVAGKIIAGFGPAGKGLQNDGINIEAPAGTLVRAADNGVVAYAGNELKGFGNLLLIKHADGWTTAYAHNEKLLVARGDEVNQGQPIALVGRTGNVDSPQVHFEVRKGTQAMDPMPYLAQVIE